MPSDVIVSIFWSVVFAAVVGWAVAYFATRRYLKWGREQKQELASARRALELVEKDAREYQTDLLSDLMLAHVERYKAREIERNH